MQISPGATGSSPMKTAWIIEEEEETFHQWEEHWKMFFPPFFKPYLEDFQMFWILKKQQQQKTEK